MLISTGDLDFLPLWVEMSTMCKKCVLLCLWGGGDRVDMDLESRASTGIPRRYVVVLTYSWSIEVYRRSDSSGLCPKVGMQEELGQVHDVVVPGATAP